jgi:exodeoxyribonuclease V gamma subunit
VARHEAEARWLGLRLRRELGNRDLPRHIAAMGGTLDLRARLDELVGGCGPLGDAAPPLPSRLRITLKELRRWLECPIQGGVALRLGVKNLDETDFAEVEDFPVDSSTLDQWWLLRRSFWAGCGAQADFESIYEQMRREKEIQAKAPIGALSQGERRRHVALLDRWAKLVGITDGLNLPRFGTGLPFETLGLRVQEHPALVLGFDHPQGHTEIHLEGLTEPLRGDAFLLLSTRDCGKGGPKEKARLDSLRAWLGHLALCATGESRQRFAQLHSAPRMGPDSVWRLPLTPVSPDEAKAQLTSWCREILLDEEPKLLPIEALLSGKEIPDLRDWIQDQHDDEDRSTLTSFRGLVPRVKELPVDDLATGRRRLGAFLDLQSGWVQA